MSEDNFDSHKAIESSEVQIAKDLEPDEVIDEEIKLLRERLKTTGDTDIQFLKKTDDTSRSHFEIGGGRLQEKAVFWDIYDENINDKRDPMQFLAKSREDIEKDTNSELVPPNALGRIATRYLQPNSKDGKTEPVLTFEFWGNISATDALKFSDSVNTEIPRSLPNQLTILTNGRKNNELVEKIKAAVVFMEPHLKPTH